MSDVHVMIDLETLGTGSKAAIIQLGARKFNFLTGAEESSFERTISLQSSLFAGLEMDADTLAWWKKQSAEAQWAVCRDGQDLETVLFHFVDWLGDAELCAWSNGAGFDIVILENAFRLVGLDIPWKYNSARDVRTLFWMAQQVGWQKRQRVVAHTALADCDAQIKDCVGAFSRIKAM